LVDVELLGAEAGADGRDQRLDLGVLQHLVEAGPLDVEDLAADGQDGLGARVAGAEVAEPPAESPSTMNSSHSLRSRLEQSRSLSGMPAPSSALLRRVASRALRAAARARWAA
jgi:hypothetical protein